MPSKLAESDAQCIVCHRIGNSGGSVGPELASASSKYTLHDILDSMIEPSKVVSEQFLTYNIVKKDGESVSGRIVDDNAQRIVVMSNPMAAEALDAAERLVAGRPEIELLWARRDLRRSDD